MALTPKQIERAAEDIAGMANAVRLEILKLLMDGEYTVGELVGLIRISQSAMSQHLAKLRALDLVCTRREAQTIFYSCKSPKVAAILAAIKRGGKPTAERFAGNFPAGTVLIVEDDYSLACEVTSLFRGAGANILGPVAREEDAYALLRTEKPDLAIIDLNLGMGIRFEFAEQLRRLNVPLCIVTGYSREAIPNIPTALDDIPWLQKPIAAHALLTMAARALH